MAKILYFEDDQELSEYILQLLESSGHTVEHSFTGSDALQRIQSFMPDLILLDLTLPDKDGVDIYISTSSHLGAQHAL